MATQNKINNFSNGLTVNDLLMSGNTISSDTDLVFTINPTYNLIFENSTNTILNLTSDGELTTPYQVSFLSSTSSLQANVTGGAVPYVMYFDLTKYDIGGHFDDQYFVAPVSGIYYFSCSCVVTGLISAMTSLRINLVTSIQTYNAFTNAYGISTAGTQSSISINIITQMDIGDICNIELTITGGTTTADVDGASTLRTYFSGHRIA